MDRKAVGFCAAASASLGVLLSAGCGTESAQPARVAQRETRSSVPAPVVVVSPEPHFFESERPAVAEESPVTAISTASEPAVGAVPVVDPYAETSTDTQPSGEMQVVADGAAAPSEMSVTSESLAEASTPATDSEETEPVAAEPLAEEVASSVELRFSEGSVPEEVSDAAKTVAVEVGPRGKSTPRQPELSRARGSNQRRTLQPLVVTPRQEPGQPKPAELAQAEPKLAKPRVAEPTVVATEDEVETPKLAKSAEVKPAAVPTRAEPRAASKLVPAPVAIVATQPKVAAARPVAMPATPVEKPIESIVAEPTPAKPSPAVVVESAPQPVAQEAVVSKEAVVEQEVAQAEPTEAEADADADADADAETPAPKAVEMAAEASQPEPVAVNPSTLRMAEVKVASEPEPVAVATPAAPKPVEPKLAEVAATQPASTQPVISKPAISKPEAAEPTLARKSPEPSVTAAVAPTPTPAATAEATVAVQPVVTPEPQVVPQPQVAPERAIAKNQPQPVVAAPTPVVAAPVTAPPAPAIAQAAPVQPVAVQPAPVQPAPAQSVATTPSQPVAAPMQPTAPVRSPALVASMAQADERVRHAIQLAEKGAMYASRKEFTSALTLISQARDIEYSTRQYSQATAAGLQALKESNDFVKPSGATADLSRVVAGHKTPILKGLDVSDLPPTLAAQHYYDYAKVQLAAGIGRETVGSIALYGLGRIIVAGAGANAQQLEYTGPAMALYQAALICEPQNFRAAHELGVLLASTGQLELARNMLLGSASASPQPMMWKNLAVVHSRLGEAQLAAEAHQKATVLEQTTPNAKTPAVQWVDPATFSQLGSASDPTLLPSSANPATASPAEAAPAKKPSNVARSRGEWDPLNLRR